MTLSETLDDVLTSIEAFLVGVVDVIFSIGSKSPNYSSGIPELFLQLSSHNFKKKILSKFCYLNSISFNSIDLKNFKTVEQKISK